MSNVFEIEEVRLVCERVQKIPSNCDCPICWCSIHSSSISNQSKGKPSDVVISACDHAFHTECIESWISNNPTCPICSSKWKVKKVLKSINTSIDELDIEQVKLD